MLDQSHPLKDVTCTSSIGSSWWWLAVSCPEIYAQPTVHLKTQLFIKIQLNIQLWYIHPPISCLPLLNYIPDCMHLPPWLSYPIVFASLTAPVCLLVSALLLPSLPVLLLSASSCLLQPSSYLHPPPSLPTGLCFSACMPPCMPA
jgi:hypothetical protein